MKLDGANAGAICAEPPPDVGEALAKSLSASLTADIATQAGAKGEGEVEFDRELATAVTALLRRSQGLQLLRDQNYDLCVDRMNGWLSNTEYQSRKREILREASELIEVEVQEGSFPGTFQETTELTTDE